MVLTHFGGSYIIVRNNRLLGEWSLTTWKLFHLSGHKQASVAHTRSEVELSGNLEGLCFHWKFGVKFSRWSFVRCSATLSDK